jgi:hypothetical protein
VSQGPQIGAHRAKWIVAHAVAARKSLNEMLTKKNVKTLISEQDLKNIVNSAKSKDDAVNKLIAKYKELNKADLLNVFKDFT